MKIIIYCQHVLGVGHFFRTLELTRAMEMFEVILVTGGPSVDVPMPSHVRQVHLEGLMMDKDFSGLHCVNPAKSLENVKKERERQLLELVVKENPDFFLVELYPFGRRAFRFELIPTLDYLKTHGNCTIACSLRDILVEKSDPQKYETRVIQALNQWFDAVLIHSDPDLIKLNTTFSRLGEIKAPLIYTGFVTPLPDPVIAERLRKEAGIGPDEKWIVASAGGGNVGADLLKAVARVFRSKTLPDNIRLDIFTGPYMEKSDTAFLYDLAGPRIRVAPFAQDFVSLLAAADLSISMGGYNTCMNIVAATVPALIWPFAQNREQRERVVNLARFTPMTLLENHNLEPDQLTQLILDRLNPGNACHPSLTLDISGAQNTVQWMRKGENP